MSDALDVRKSTLGGAGGEISSENWSIWTEIVTSEAAQKVNFRDARSKGIFGGPFSSHCATAVTRVRSS